MTCKDFERKWNELLDAEAGVGGTPGAALVAPEGAHSIGEAEALLQAHAIDCPTCRPIAARYQTLRHAIRAWRQPLAPPADLVHRVLSAPDDPTPGTGRAAARRARRFWYDHRAQPNLVSRFAAIVLVSLGVAWFVLPQINRAPRVQPRAVDLHATAGPQQAPGGPPALDRALAEATSATLDLARSASEPAARIGRDVLDATTQTDDRAVVQPVQSSAKTSAEPDEGLASLSVAVPSLDPLGSDAAEASTVLQQVGDHLSAGVQPLSNTARHAFGFLLGSPPPHAGSRPDGSTSSGARSG